MNVELSKRIHYSNFSFKKIFIFFIINESIYFVKKKIDRERIDIIRCESLFQEICFARVLKIIDRVSHG